MKNYNFLRTDSESNPLTSPPKSTPIAPTTGNENNELSFDEKKIASIASSNKSKEDIKGSINRTKCFKIVEKVKVKKGLPDLESAMTLITGLCQKGGSNKNAGNTIYERNGKSLSSSELHIIIEEIEKKGTIRQFARTMANDIANFAIIMEEEGDLAKQIKLQHPNLSNEELVWCSNFQTNNPNCPKRIKDWLVENYNKRFRN